MEVMGNRQKHASVVNEDDTLWKEKSCAMVVLHSFITGIALPVVAQVGIVRTDRSGQEYLSSEEDRGTMAGNQKCS